MSLQLITARTEWPVELPEVKAHCRITATDDDALLQELIIASTDKAETENDLALNTMTFDLLLDDFPNVIEIWKWPIASVTSVKYTDTDGNTQTVTGTNYSTDLYGYPARIARVPTYSWPDPKDIPNAVQVRFVTGFGSDVIPGKIKQAIYLVIKDFYDNREDKGRRFPRVSERILKNCKYSNG
jgi:uncharacterized phiE125 gp8 family phage protein